MLASFQDHRDNISCRATQSRSVWRNRHIQHTPRRKDNQLVRRNVPNPWTTKLALISIRSAPWMRLKTHENCMCSPSKRRLFHVPDQAADLYKKFSDFNVKECHIHLLKTNHVAAASPKLTVGFTTRRSPIRQCHSAFRPFTNLLKAGVRNRRQRTWRLLESWINC